MEVSQISRTIARSLGLNEDLCETLSLSHDLGHTPFGHAGEEALNQCMYNFGGFNHNIQTIRIVVLIESKYYKFSGLNLSIETLDGLIKHNGPVIDKSPYENIFELNKMKKKIIFNEYSSLESQVAAISDDIAYNNHDLEDGLRAKLFNLENLKSIPFLSTIINKHIKNLKTFRREIIVNQIVRELINEMVMDVIRSTNYNIRKFKIKSLKDVYKQDELTVDFSYKMKNSVNQIRNFLKDNMYNNKRVLIKTNHGKKVINNLFKYIVKKPEKFINNDMLNKTDKTRAIADFIAGMTDRYAINLHNLIK